MRAADTLHLTIQPAPDDALLAAVRAPLSRFNHAAAAAMGLPPVTPDRFAVVLNRADTPTVDEGAGAGAGAAVSTDAVLGGCIAEVYWGWAYVSALSVAEHARGQGLGSRLLAAAKTEAVRRGARHAYLDTFSFQARPFYERHGWRVFGQLNDFPPGQTRYFLTKRLAETDGALPPLPALP